MSTCKISSIDVMNLIDAIHQGRVIIQFFLVTSAIYVYNHAVFFSFSACQTLHLVNLISEFSNLTRRLPSSMYKQHNKGWSTLMKLIR